MSSYLYDLILEGQSYRREGFLSREDSEERIDELEREVAALEQQLERKRSKNFGRPEVDDEEFVTQYLADEYRTLGEIIQLVVESGALDDLVGNESRISCTFSLPGTVFTSNPATAGS